MNEEEYRDEMDGDPDAELDQLAAENGANNSGPNRNFKAVKC